MFIVHSPIRLTIKQESGPPPVIPRGRIKVFGYNYTKPSLQTKFDFQDLFSK